MRKEIFDVGWDPVIDLLAGAGFRHVEPFGTSTTAPLLAPARGNLIASRLGSA
ncbi:hypothetical protein AB6813_12455 [bacterium RCC_150]